MKLEDLPHFTVDEIRSSDQRGKVLVIGSFSHLRGVALTRGWLYRFMSAHIDGWLTDLDREKLIGAFRTRGAYVKKLGVRSGDEFSWIDSYWKAKDVDRLLDAKAIWHESVFEPTNAFEFHSKGSRIRGKLEQGVPGHVLAHEVIPGGWDHEHCRLCLTTIDAGRRYYQNEDFLVCKDCFVRFVSTHDLSFMENFWPKKPS